MQITCDLFAILTVNVLLLLLHTRLMSYQPWKILAFTAVLIWKFFARRVVLFRLINVWIEFELVWAVSGDEHGGSKNLCVWDV